jgi:excisionase family DNA binding protein
MADMTNSFARRRVQRKSISLPTIEQAAAARLAVALTTSAPGDRQAVQMVDADGHHIAIPAAIAEIMAQAAGLLADGYRVTVLPDDEYLTTQTAADRLHVSRQYVVRLIDQAVLPSTKVGSHRRVRANDVAAYKADRDARRDAALDRLAALSEDAGGDGVCR